MCVSEMYSKYAVRARAHQQSFNFHVINYKKRTPPHDARKCSCCTRTSVVCATETRVYDFAFRISQTLRCVWGWSDSVYNIPSCIVLVPSNMPLCERFQFRRNRGWGRRARFWSVGMCLCDSMFNGNPGVIMRACVCVCIDYRERAAR